MGWSALSLLTAPWFVIPWYAVGLAGSAFVAWDVTKRNTVLEKPTRWAWPVVVLFFSVIGLLLYFTTARPRGIGRTTSEEEKRATHEAYHRSTFRRVNAAAVHSVAGDGLGVMTAMVIARATNLTFWEEFWFEYAVGFLFGWFVFQRRSMTDRTRSTPRALALAFRAELFSMFTVMGGVGAVMAFVTPAVAGAQPSPLTYAFWGFGVLGLLAGYVLTFPMSWMMVKMGWKYGVGGPEGARPLARLWAKAVVFGVMSSFGLAALVLVAWLAERRVGTPLAGMPVLSIPAGAKGEAMQIGLLEDVLVASDALVTGRRGDATNALDAARRAAEVGAEALPHSGLREVLHDIEAAERALDMGDLRSARRALVLVLGDVVSLHGSRVRVTKPLRSYRGVPVVNAQGVVIGEVERVDGDQVRIALGRGRDVLGFWDVRTERVVVVPMRGLVFGPRHRLGRSFVMLPTLETTPLGVAYASPGRRV